MQTVDLAELQRARLRRILYFTADALAHYEPEIETQILFLPQPCERCTAQAIKHAVWEAELQSELSKLSHEPHTTNEQEKKQQWEVIET